MTKMGIIWSDVENVLNLDHDDGGGILSICWKPLKCKRQKGDVIYEYLRKDIFKLIKTQASTIEVMEN